MSAICSILVVRNRRFLRYIVSPFCILLFPIMLLLQPVLAQAGNLPDNSSPDQVMSKMKERLKLTEEQETKIRPIIEESIQKRYEILKNGSQDRSTTKSELQELQWKTDMRVGVILTEEQRKEYEKLREEQAEKTQHNDAQGSRGPRGSRSRGF